MPWREYTGIDSCYHVFRTDKGRLIQEPNPELKRQQQHWLQDLYGRCPIHARAYGGVPNQSIYTCALVHVGAKWMLKMDVRKFYQSITLQMIQDGITLTCNSERLNNVRREMMNNLEHCLYHCDNHGERYLMLPTGAPTSPVLANIACYKLDSQLSRAADVLKNDLRSQWGGDVRVEYTRYFDDLTFSIHVNEGHLGLGVGPDSLKKPWRFISEVESYCNHHGLTIHRGKTRWMTRGSDNMMILGIAQSPVGELRVPRNVYRKIRALMWNMGLKGQDITQFDDVKGMLAYVNAINPGQHLKLLEQYHEAQRQ
jgi:RNA-directed DNA polymerase